MHQLRRSELGVALVACGVGRVARGGLLRLGRNGRGELSKRLFCHFFSFLLREKKRQLIFFRQPGAGAGRGCGEWGDGTGGVLDARSGCSCLRSAKGGVQAWLVREVDGVEDGRARHAWGVVKDGRAVPWLLFFASSTCKAKKCPRVVKLGLEM
jgi:hypothetical protein